MNSQILNLFTIPFVVAFIFACNNPSVESAHKHENNGEGPGSEAAINQEMEHGRYEGEKVFLSELKFNSLGIQVDTLPLRSMSGVVYANGQLEVPPQHEATVTAMLGGNVSAIKVIEGDKVRKGQVLAYLVHPDFIKLQSAYVKALSQSKYLEQEYSRQKKLYEEEVGSGQKFQEAESKYLAIQADVKAYEAQLKQLKLNPSRIREGSIYEQIPVVSPIDGFIEKVLIQIGQYVAPTTSLFMIVNTQHIHADLMVFEKDVARVKEGQQVTFMLESAGDTPLTARIYSVGKQFEQNPKAVHLHAEILHKQDYLIPGMYINGKIQVENKAVRALPEQAIVEDEGKSFIFMAEKREEEGKIEWVFEPVEIRTGIVDEGWVEINLLAPMPEGAKVAWSGAYYLISEMKKGETSHEH